MKAWIVRKKYEFAATVVLLKQEEKQGLLRCRPRFVKALTFATLRYAEYRRWISITKRARRKWIGVMTTTGLPLSKNAVFIVRISRAASVKNVLQKYIARRLKAMDRLTSKDEHGKNVIITSEDWGYSENHGTLKLQGCIADKLADYENTGLSPAEISAIKADNDRLHALIDDFESVLARKKVSDENAQ